MLFFVFCALLVGLFVLSMRWPHYALVVAWAMNGIDQLGMVSHPFLAQRGYLTNIIIGFIVGLAFVRSLFYRESVPWHNKMISVSLFALVVYSLISLVWSPMQGKGWFEWRSGAHAWCILVALLPLIVTKSERLLQAIELFYPVALLLISIFIFGIEWGRRGMMVDSNTSTTPLALAELGGYLVIVSGLLTSKRSTVWTCVRAGGFVLGLMIAAKTGSRGQFFASVIAILMCLPLTTSFSRLITPRNLLVGSLLMLVGGVAVQRVVAGESELNQSRFEQDTMSDSYGLRLEMSQQLLSVALREPKSTIFGLGNSASFHHEIIGIYPHIIAVEVLGEEGVVGALMFCSLLWFTVVGVFQLAVRENRTETESTLLAILVAFIVFHFFIACKQGSLIRSPNFWSAFLLFERFQNIAWRDFNEPGSTHL